MCSPVALREKTRVAVLEFFFCSRAVLPLDVVELCAFVARVLVCVFPCVLLVAIGTHVSINISEYFCDYMFCIPMCLCSRSLLVLSY